MQSDSAYKIIKTRSCKEVYVESSFTLLLLPSTKCFFHHTTHKPALNIKSATSSTANSPSTELVNQKLSTRVRNYLSFRIYCFDSTRKSFLLYHDHCVHHSSKLHAIGINNNGSTHGRMKISIARVGETICTMTFMVHLNSDHYFYHNYYIIRTTCTFSLPTLNINSSIFLNNAYACVYS